ncbi:hypothetical protein HYU06_00895 [Candidatus Woesearchaeota archaeon]|nr:hypothetical protein [Candidatus Woesearchaeota archaeon]
MYVKTIFPQKDTISTLIIAVLSRNYPLSKMKLFNTIKSEHKKNITYQGVSKVVGQLAEEGILQRQGKEYALNSEWINNLHKFSQELKGNYTKGKLGLIDKNTTEATFYTVGEFIDFTFNNLNTDFLGCEKGKKIALQLRNIGFMPVSRAHIAHLKKFMETNEMYVAVQGNTIVDKTLSKFLKSFGIKVKLGADCAKDSLVLVTENCLVNIYESDELRKELRSIYHDAKGLKDQKLMGFFRDILFKQYTYHVTFNRNKELAAKILKQTLAFFEK